MTIDQIREKLAIKLSQNDTWLDLLNDTNPGHYGVEDWEVYLTDENIWVDIPNKIFSFKNVNFNFELLLGSSNYDDATKMQFSKKANGKGIFEFSSKGQDVIIENFEANFDTDLFS